MHCRGPLRKGQIRVLHDRYGLIENRLRQSLRQCVIGDDLPDALETRNDPHEGQKGPPVHMADSNHFLALASVANIFAIAWSDKETRSDLSGPSLPVVPLPALQ